jgi:hypothetical protein
MEPITLRPVVCSTVWRNFVSVAFRHCLVASAVRALWSGGTVAFPLGSA